MFKTISAISTAVTGEAPWWMGVPTKLVKKTTLVSGKASVSSLAPDSTENLPVHALTFEIPKNARFNGRAQPHETVRVDLGDVVKMVIPGCKPKSCSMSALRDNEFDVTFKVHPNGRASGFLDCLQKGDSINSFGLHCNKTRQPGSHVGSVACGVGIAEARPIAHSELEKGDAQKVVLPWASWTPAGTFWTEEMKEVEAQHADRFQLANAFSREQVAGSLHGCINPANLVARLS